MERSRSLNLRGLGLLTALLTALLVGVIAAPSAMATPPPNDEFNEPTIMPSTLPVEVEGSNVGATIGPRETGLYYEPAPVWFAWTAPETRVVSLGTCGTTFSWAIEVLEYRGSEETGPVDTGKTGDSGCAYGVTFRAIAGVEYRIKVAGASYVPPPPGAPPPASGEFPPPPVTEGTIRLGISPTPPPPNDDFADAAPLTTSTWEEPSGLRYNAAYAEGYTWGATREPGEPAHGGTGSNGSVWYSWVAPVSAKASATPTISSEQGVLGVYTGSALSGLTPVGSCFSSAPEYCFAPFYAEAGRRYWIAVDSAAKAGEEPWVGSFSLMLVQWLPNGPGYDPNGDSGTKVQGQASPPPAAPAPAPSPGAPASPRLRARSIDAHHRRATIRFSDATPGAGFRCRVDRRRFRECSSPATMKGLKAGRHRFAVVAHIEGGPASRPTVTHFRIAAARRK